MNKLQCELCGSVDIVKTADNLFQCRYCGCKYTLEQAKRMVQGTVEVVKGDAYLSKAIENVKAKANLEEYEEAYQDLKDLTKSYPGECKVYVETLEFIYKWVKNGKVIDYALLCDIYVSLNKALKTATDEKQKNTASSRNKIFLSNVIKAYPSRKLLDVFDVFTHFIEAKKKGEKYPDGMILDFAVEESLKLLNKGDKYILKAWAEDFETFINAHPLIKKCAETEWKEAARKMNTGGYGYRLGELFYDGGYELFLIKGSYKSLGDNLVEVKYFLPTIVFFRSSKKKIEYWHKQVAEDEYLYGNYESALSRFPKFSSIRCPYCHANVLCIPKKTMGGKYRCSNNNCKKTIDPFLCIGYESKPEGFRNY